MAIPYLGWSVMLDDPCEPRVLLPKARARAQKVKALIEEHDVRPFKGDQRWMKGGPEGEAVTKIPSTFHDCSRALLGVPVSLALGSMPLRFVFPFPRG